jgi:hypothetical protein
MLSATTDAISIEFLNEVIFLQFRPSSLKSSGAMPFLGPMGAYRLKYQVCIGHGCSPFLPSECSSIVIKLITCFP